MTEQPETTVRIALFGGSFDPPHTAHEMVCRYTLDAADVSELWIVPCFEHPLQKPLTPWNHRYEMCRLIAAGLERVTVSDVELKLGAPSRTLYTLRHLRSVHADHTFVLTVGGDILEEKHEWFGWDEITRLAELFVVERKGYSHKGEVQFPEISSSQIREAVAAGQPVEGLVNARVADYIREHGLYRKE